MLFPNTVAHQRETVNLLKAGVSNMLNLVSSIKDKYFPGKSRRRRTGRPERRRRSGAGPESLEERTLLAAEIGVAWNPDVMSYKLDITGTESDDVITVEIEQGVPNQIHAEVKDGVGNVLAEATYNAGMFYEVSIAGLGGDDTIISDTGLTEYIFTGDGNDDVWGGDGHDTLLGGYGVDILYGSTGNDSLMGSDGNDFIYGSEGDDYLNGGFGHDIMTGGHGHDYMEGGSGNDNMDGGYGEDWMYGNSGNDTMVGGSSSDFGTDYLFGGQGNDFMKGGNGTDFLHGDNGADILLGEGGTDYLFGDAGADFLNGGTGNDHLEGGTGADTLHGMQGNDYLDGGYDAAVDQLFGGAVDDTLVQHMKRFNFGGGMWWWLHEDALNDYDSDDDSLLNVFHNW